MALPAYQFYKQKFSRPEVYQVEMLRKYVQGAFVEHGEIISPFFRAQIISVDYKGGQLENPKAEGVCRSRNAQSNDYYDIPASAGPENPARAVRARIITNHFDSGRSDSELRIFWPMFPAMGAADPIALEFVYVFFEQNDRKHGMWVSKVPGPLGEQVNFAPGSQIYKDNAKDSGDHPLAASHGDAPPASKHYDSQESLTGAKTDDASLSGNEFKP